MNAPAKILTPQEEWDALVPRLREMEREIDQMRRSVLFNPKTDTALRGIRFALRCALGDY